MVIMGNLKNGVVAMIPDETLLSDFEPGRGPSTPELLRLQTLERLKLLEPDSVPIFEEATQTAAHFLNAPICVLSLLDRDRVWFKSAVGLSRIGLLNNLATSRQLPRHEAFCARVVETRQVLKIEDAEADPLFAQMLLVERYGIRAYLGVPLVAASGHCVGTLAVMGLVPRTFSEQEIAFLELMARWAMSEFERNRLQQQPAVVAPSPAQPTGLVKADLLSQMVQELRTPLTSVLGMAKVLNQGIYAGRPDKQQEYIQIIHDSGQYLLALVNEIIDLGSLDHQNKALTLAPIDIEMLCQQAITTLQQVAQRREQEIQLTVEPGNRIWFLDKDKVRQLLYHLVFSVVQSSSSESTIRIHVSRKQQALHLSVWASHPWLGEGISQVGLTGSAPAFNLASSQSAASWNATEQWISPKMTTGMTDHALPSESADATKRDGAPIETRQSLGLVLSGQLAELHGGDIVIQGSVEEGYRYVVRLPQLKSVTAQAS
jgi:signal transduction histidine kinase